MRVLLLADPPAGDHIDEKLRSLGIKTEYARGRRGGAQIAAIHAGFEWVISMNAHCPATALREKAHKVGAKFTSIPPGWTAAEALLRDRNFFADLYLKQPGPLTTKPFAGLLTQETDMPPKMNGTNGATAHQLPAPPPPPEPVAAAKSAPAPDPWGPEAALRLARETWTRDPNIAGRDVVDNLRRLGFPVNRETCSALSTVRRELRKAAGLNVLGGARHSASTRGRRNVILLPEGTPALPEVPAPPPPPVLAVPPPADDGSLPAPLLAAAQLLAEEIRKADLVGFIAVSDQGEVSGEISTRRRVTVRAKV